MSLDNLSTTLESTYPQWNIRLKTNRIIVSGDFTKAEIKENNSTYTINLFDDNGSNSDTFIESSVDSIQTILETHIH